MANQSQHSSSEELRQAVRDAISRSEPLRATGLDHMRIEVAEARVTLRGLVASDAHSYLAEQLARAVHGVQDVQNDLLTYEQLEHEIAVALVSSESTRHLRIAVRVLGQNVGLYGAVPSQGDSEKVISVAGLAAHGFTVQNHLRIVPPGKDVVLLWQNSLEGRREEAAGRPPKPVEVAASEPAPEGAPAVTPPPAAVGGTA